MTIRQRTIDKLKKHYRDLTLLEAIDAFYQMAGLVVGEPNAYPSKLKESLLELHRHLLALVQENVKEGDLREDVILKLINTIEEDVYRISYNADTILARVHKIKSIFLPQDNRDKFLL